ncbi:TMPPE-like protein [Mya arenaria]|uniref:TMPPE-like protein n=2 Tax=Mya arenaria TaxID=6604 RepID=A0ABY7ERI8_MYAAR|nr:TMPPE-like protein [Mya arenaria]
MATFTRGKVFGVVFVLILLYILNKSIVMNMENSTLRAKLLRFQFSCIIMSGMTLICCYLWRNLSTVLDSTQDKVHSETESNEWRLFIDFKDIREWRSYTINAAISRLLLAAVLISSLFSYSSFSFLIAINPYKLAIWLFLALAVTIQLFTAVVFLKIVNLILRLGGRKKTRTFSKLSKIQQISAFVYAMLIVMFGYINAQQPPTIKEVTIPVKGLPENLERLSITFVSDIHLGPTNGMDRLKKIINMINYLNSDMVIIGGDLVDGRVDQLHDAAVPISWINSKYGTYFVTGNHEYYTTDAENWLVKLKSLGVIPLHNINVKISADKGQTGICLAGVDDPTADQYKFGDHTMDLDGALGSCDVESPVILVAHQPKAAQAALQSKHRVDLVLSGHTHGGQFFPLIIPAYLMNPFYAGLYRHGDHSHVYVSQGTLFASIPIRFGTTMEITRIFLTQA